MKRPTTDYVRESVGGALMKTAEESTPRLIRFSDEKSPACALAKGDLWTNHHHIELPSNRNIAPGYYPPFGGTGTESLTSGVGQIQI